MHTTIELLRHLGHRLKLVQKLKQQLEASPQLLDLAKAAKLLTDINAVSKEVDFSGVAAAEADDGFLQQAAAHIHDQAQVRPYLIVPQFGSGCVTRYTCNRQQPTSMTKRR
jgi:hypothetical protein